jgi:SprT protein
MPLFRQLEFRFEQGGTRSPSALAIHGGEAALFSASVRAGLALSERPIHLPPTSMLESIARELLRSNGAGRIANRILVEWNPRLKTCAGRADYHRKRITLNPQLVHHPAEVEGTLRHELAHFLAQFRSGRRRIPPHGEQWRVACRDLGIENEPRCHNLPFAKKPYAARFVYRCPNCRQNFPRVRRIRRAVACLACCRKYNGGDFDARFRLKLMSAA